MQTLAEKFRPKSLDDIVGQEHILGKGKVLRRLIENKNVSNLIFFGPPGIGKTTIAQLVVKGSNKKLFKLNGTTASVKDIQEIAKTLDTLEGYNGVVVYLDEIHAFSKNRQSSILSYLETGQITLIASTTENPYHSIHPAILSRCMVFELKPISNEDIIKRLKVCINKASDSWRNISYDDDALKYIANISNGDLRKAISILELIINSYLTEELHIDVDIVKEVSQKNIVMDESQYYDCISMLQKSIRGSDADASVYYLGRLIHSGDFESIYRRLSVIAYEDIGLANPSMGPKVMAAIEAAELVGLPEARIPLGTVVVELALSPKSNTAHIALDAALNDIRRGNTGNVPNHIKTNSIDYKYPHDYPNNWVKQQYLPDNIKDRKYFKPKANSKYEQSLKQVYENLEKKQGN